MTSGCTLLPGEPRTQVSATTVPTPAIPASTTTEPGLLTPYTVVRGDTLIQIADRHGIHLNDLVRVNNIADPTKIFVGQILLIPPPPRSERRAGAHHRSRHRPRPSAAAADDHGAARHRPRIWLMSAARQIARFDNAVDRWWGSPAWPQVGRPRHVRRFRRRRVQPAVARAGCDSGLWGHAGRPSDALRFSALMALESLVVNQGIKRLFARRRPDTAADNPTNHRLRQPITSSFPSGHGVGGVLRCSRAVAQVSARTALPSGGQHRGHITHTRALASRE